MIVRISGESMRIAMIGHKDFPSRSGGVEVVVQELATRLAQKGHDVTVYNRGLQKGHNRYDCEGVHVIRSWTVKKQALNAMLYSLTATLKMLGKPYEVVHYHAIGPSAMLPLARLFGKRTVATIHGLDWKRAKWGNFASKYLMFGEKMIAKYANEVIVLSENDEKYFKERYHRDCTRISNAINPIHTLPCKQLKERFGLQKNGYILFLSRIVPEKGLHYLIEAFKRLDTDKKLVIAGEIPDTEYGHRICAMATDSEDIILAGFASGETLAELYSNCCLFVQPSEIEGLALTLLEALSAGAKCLVSDIPENTSVAGEFTRSFKCSNVDDLERMLKACLAEGDDHPLAERQMQYIADHYGYDRVLSATLEVYRRAANAARAIGGVEA